MWTTTGALGRWRKRRTFRRAKRCWRCTCRTRARSRRRTTAGACTTRSSSATTFNMRGSACSSRSTGSILRSVCSVRTFAARRMHGAILDGIERLTEKQQQIAVRQRLRREQCRIGQGPGGCQNRPIRRQAAAERGYSAISPTSGSAWRSVNCWRERAWSTSPPVWTRRLPTDTISRWKWPNCNSDCSRSSIGSACSSARWSATTTCRTIPSKTSRIHVRHRGRISQIHRQALSTLRILLAVPATCDVSW